MEWFGLPGPHARSPQTLHRHELWRVPGNYLPAHSKGSQKIQAGSTRYTLCDEAPYEDRITFHWDGTGFRQELKHTISVPKELSPNRCTLDWAIKAGPGNDQAVGLLAAAVKDWPEEADQDWGPAARDYFRIKLATWYFQRDRLAEGLGLLKQVREHPFASDYSFAAKVASTFLDAYYQYGWYRAVHEVDDLYRSELEPFSGPCFGVCEIDELRKQWGFAEREWGIWYGNGFEDDFLGFDALSLALKQNPPASLEALPVWLGHNKLSLIWSVEGDLDGRGEKDWLVLTRGWPTCHCQSNSFVFLRGSWGVIAVPAKDIYAEPQNPPQEYHLQSFFPVPGVPPVNILQVGKDLYAFQIQKGSGSYRVDMQINSADISPFDTGDPIEVQDWKVEGGQLLVQYNQREAVYMWDAAQKKIVPTGFAPELQEENTAKAEQALYIDNDPGKVVEILRSLLEEHVYENFDWMWMEDYINPPRLRPYLLYLLGLAYERSGDETNAVQAYWQLWHDYPASPYSLAAQSKLDY